VTINCFSDWSKAVAAKKEADMKSDSKREAYISVSTETVTTMAHSVMPYADTGDSNLLGKSRVKSPKPLYHVCSAN
jgi:hypothetical protein